MPEGRLHTVGSWISAIRRLVTTGSLWAPANVSPMDARIYLLIAANAHRIAQYGCDLRLDRADSGAPRGHGGYAHALRASVEQREERTLMTTSIRLAVFDSGNPLHLSVPLDVDEGVVRDAA